MTTRRLFPWALVFCLLAASSVLCAGQSMSGQFPEEGIGDRGDEETFQRLLKEMLDKNGKKLGDPHFTAVHGCPDGVRLLYQGSASAGS